MDYDNRNYGGGQDGGRHDGVYSQRLRAGRRRTYFFDVRTTRANDYYLTITESKKRFDGRGYDRHKLFIYKEDFNQFMDMLTQTMDHVKNELMPDYDFDEFHREREARRQEWEAKKAEEDEAFDFSNDDAPAAEASEAEAPAEEPASEEAPANDAPAEAPATEDDDEDLTL